MKSSACAAVTRNWPRGLARFVACGGGELVGLAAREVPPVAGERSKRKHKQRAAPRAHQAREQRVGPDAGARGAPRRRLDLRSQIARDLVGVAQAGHIKVGLVAGQRLHRGCRAHEDAVHLEGAKGVCAHMSVAVWHAAASRQMQLSAYGKPVKAATPTYARRAPTPYPARTSMLMRS